MASFGYSLPQKLRRLDPSVEQRIKSEPDDRYCKESYLKQTTQQSISFAPNMYNPPRDTSTSPFGIVNGIYSGPHFYWLEKNDFDSFHCRKHNGESSPLLVKTDSEMPGFYSPLDLTRHNSNVAETFFSSSSQRKSRSSDNVPFLKTTPYVCNGELHKTTLSKKEGLIENLAELH